MLRFNESNGSFILYTKDDEAAGRAGLTLSTEIRGPAGEKVYFTSDHSNRPDFNPYAALEFYAEADDTARAKLRPLMQDYRASWADTSSIEVPCPDGKEFLPYQRAGIEYALRRGNCIIGDQPGLGKESDINNLVATPKGWRKLGDLKLGDLVATVDGSFTPVSGIFPQGIKRSYRVKFRDGTSTTCGAEHLWAVSSPLRRKRAKQYDRNEFIVKTTQELIDGGLTGTRGAGNSNRTNAKWYIPLVQPIQYPGADLQINPYVLGVLIGDGCTTSSPIRFSNPDIDSDIRKRVFERLPDNIDLRAYYPKNNGCPYFTLVGQNVKDIIWNKLVDLGLNVKSPIKFIPEEYQIASVEQRIELLRGLMDTDGSCSKNRTVFHTVSPQLAEDIALLVRSLGGVAIVRGYDRSHESKPYEYQVNVKTVFCPFHTQRKVSQWRQAKQPPIKYITSIEDTGLAVEQICIRVEHPSHLYVTNDYIVTHNTVQAVGVANATDARRVLVLCPASIRLNWRREIFAWSSLRSVKAQPVLKGSDGVNPSANYTICSYDLTRNKGIHGALSATDWDLIICDEGHYLKTPEAARTRAMFGGGAVGSFYHENGLDRKAKRIVSLTGTPLPNRPRECLDGSVKVLTNRGWVPIIKVRGSDFLWDGIEWVKHDGLLYQGCAKTVSVAGISATAAHRFLAKFSWVSAEEVCQNTAILNQVLEKGSRNLPWNGWTRDLMGQLKKFIVRVIAVGAPKPQFSGSGLADQLAVDHAELKQEFSPGTKSTLRSAQTRKLERGCSLYSDTLFNDATTPETEPISHTGGVGFLYGHCGKKIERLFWRTLFHFLDMKIRLCSLIGLTTKKGIFPETYDGLHASKTCKIDESYQKCKNELTDLRPVYDIANAGPRQRFTILSNKGPVISHNCYTLARGLNWESIDYLSQDAFMYRYNPSVSVGGAGHTLETKGRLPELNARLRTNLMVRRLKKDVLPQLPDKRYEMTYIEPDGAIKEVLVRESFIDFDPRDLFNPDFTLSGTPISTLRREMGEAMANRVVEYTRYLLDVVELPKVILYAHHKSVIAALSGALDQYGVCLHTGGMSTPAKEQAKIDFVEGRERIFLGQLDTMEGVDGLQHVCGDVVFAEPAWTPGRNEQCVDRAHRIGQHDNVVAHFLLVEGSFNEKVLNIVLGKAEDIHESLDRRLIP